MHAFLPMNQPKPSPEADPQAPKPKEEAAKAPNRDDVHEQREPEQPREGVVHR